MGAFGLWPVISTRSAQAHTHAVARPTRLVPLSGARARHNLTRARMCASLFSLSLSLSLSHSRPPPLSTPSHFSLRRLDGPARGGRRHGGRRGRHDPGMERGREERCLVRSHLRRHAAPRAPERNGQEPRRSARAQGLEAWPVSCPCPPRDERECARCQRQRTRPPSAIPPFFNLGPLPPPPPHTLSLGTQRLGVRPGRLPPDRGRPAQAWHAGLRPGQPARRGGDGGDVSFR